MIRMDKRLIGKINLVLLALLVISFILVLFVPIKPLEIKNVDIKGNEFQAGGEMTFEVDRCKNVDKAVSGTASRYLVDVDHPNKQAIFISSTDDLGDKGCAKVTRTIDIPAHVKEGRYKLRFVTRYFPSVLREPLTTHYTDDEIFTVKGIEVSTRLQNILEELKLIRSETGTQVSVNTDQDMTGPDVLANTSPMARQQPAAELNTVTPTQPQSQPQQSTPQQTAPLQEDDRRIVDDLIDTVTSLIPRL